MSIKNKMAFPYPGFSPGLTARELFAAMAMQAIVTKISVLENAPDEVFDSRVGQVAKGARAYADALLVELEKTK